LARIDQPGYSEAQLLRRGPSRSRRIFERCVETALMLCGLLSIVITVTIALVLIVGSYDFFAYTDVLDSQNRVIGQREMSWDEVSERVGDFVFGTEWSAGINPADPKYGILPLICGTFLVALIAALIAVPIGLTTAIYLSEYAPPRARAIAKPTLELLAGIPTVVYGFFAVTTVTPFLALFIPGLGDPHNQLAGGIVVGIMIIPMVASLSEDALRAVPRSLRDGAIALGANKFETSVKVVVPAALSGITASFLLAISRAVGETMAVSLACGDRSRLSFDSREGIATMTSFIVRVAKGDVPHGTTLFQSLFAVAAVLFFMTLAMNIIAQKVMKRYRMVYQ
jgi:phosphate transport system permease protein